MGRPRNYFAYGSNINLDQMAHRCPDAKVVGKVTLNNYELTFRGRSDGSGVANIEPKIGASVSGLLWQITDRCEKSLDIYEGVPRLYAQKSVTVRDEDGKKHRAMAYIMTELYRDVALPSRYYYQGILEGYRQNGIDDKPLLDALVRCREQVASKIVPHKPLANKKKRKQHER